MKKQILPALLYLVLATFPGCVTPEVATNYKISDDLTAIRTLDIAVMPFLSRELTESEIEDVSDEIIDGLSNYGKIKTIVIPVENLVVQNNYNVRNIRKDSWSPYSIPKVLNKVIDRSLVDKWDSIWESYLKDKAIDTETIKEICGDLEVNTVFQVAVTNIKKTRPIHRKVIAETTAEVSYTLFSITGDVLLAGKSIATQANAWSGQLTPRPIEAVDQAPEYNVTTLSNGFTVLTESQTFPGAVHTRFAHSVGVYHTARALIRVIRRDIQVAANRE